MENKKNQRICSKGHTYYKSSSCPVCPVCAEDGKPTTGFLSLVSNPARRALEHEGILTLEKLSTFNEKEILTLHGMGPGSLPALRSSFKEVGLSFKK